MVLTTPVESYWESITPEKVFFVRALVKHFTDSKKVSQATIEVSQCEDRLDAVLPEVTRIAFFIREQYNQLGQPSNVEEDDLETATVTLTQLLELAAFLDYSDEIGRRRMHSLVRQSFQVVFSGLKYNLTIGFFNRRNAWRPELIVCMYAALRGSAKVVEQ